MGEIDEVARAIKRYTKFMELQNHCLDKCVCAVCLLHVCVIAYRLHLESAAFGDPVSNLLVQTSGRGVGSPVRCEGGVARSPDPRFNGAFTAPAH